MSIETRRVVIEDHGKEMTTDERALAMVAGLEKELNTGPIIGEAREALIQMSHNLLARDLLLDAMGVDVNKREQIFADVMRIARERDAEILKKRGES